MPEFTHISVARRGVRGGVLSLYPGGTPAANLAHRRLYAVVIWVIDNRDKAAYYRYVMQNTSLMQRWGHVPHRV